MNQEQAKSLSEFLEEARRELAAMRAEEEAERQIALIKRREEFTRAWAAVFEACAKLLPGVLQPFLRGFPKFKSEETYNDLPSNREDFELQINGLAPIRVYFEKEVIKQLHDGLTREVPKETFRSQWRLAEGTAFRVPIYERSADYFGNPEVTTSRVTDGFSPDSLLLALAEAEEAEQERARLQAEVDAERAERKACEEQREQQPIVREDTKLVEARNFNVALRRFMNAWETEELEE